MNPRRICRIHLPIGVTIGALSACLVVTPPTSAQTTTQVPAAAVVFFAADACPEGWEIFAPAEGRAVVLQGETVNPSRRNRVPWPALPWGRCHEDLWRLRRFGPLLRGDRRPNPWD